MIRMTQMQHNYDKHMIRMTQMRHTYDTHATQMRHEYDTNTTLIRHDSDTNTTRTRMWHVLSNRNGKQGSKINIFCKAHGVSGYLGPFSFFQSEMT